MTSSKLDITCFFVILFDIFFLPLFPFVSVSISLPIISYWYFKSRRKLVCVSEYRYYKLFALLMICSSFVSLFYWGDVLYETTLSTTVKRLLQFLSSLWYFFFLSYVFYKYKIDLKKYVFVLIIYISLFAILYSISPELYAQYKSIINPADSHTRRWLAGESMLVYRYTYFWADPNNVAYAIGGLCLFYVLEEKSNVLKQYIAVALTVFILFCTMSMGGIATFSLLFVFIYIFTKTFRYNLYSNLVGMILLVLLVGIIFYFWDYITFAFDSGLGKRLDSYGDDSSGGRIDDFLGSLHLFSPIFLFIGSGKEGFTSEIGHVYVYSMYGIPVYLYFLYILFSKRKGISFIRWLPIVPFFAGFTMNIAIIDQKFLLILLTISAYYTAQSKVYKDYKLEIRNRGLL